MRPHQHDENCREMFALLSEYLDLELPAETCREMEAHLEGCAPCAKFTESLKKTVELYRAYRAQEIPRPLAVDLRQQLLSSYHKMLGKRGMT